MIKTDPNLIKEMVSGDDRADGRKFDAYREIEIESNYIPLAEGSSRVKLGDTEIVVGVKMEIGEPYPDTPDEGVLITSCEFVPLASPEFESGPPGKESVEVARVVDRVIRESEAIDTKQLCIEEGEKVWLIFVDMDVIDYDGNLIDASTLGVVSALSNTYIPDLDEDGNPVYEEKGSKKLPFDKLPVNMTFVKIGDKILVDATETEENAMDARLTIGGFENSICSMQKGGDGWFSPEDIEHMLDRAEGYIKKLNGLLS